MASPVRRESRGTLGPFVRFLVTGGLSYLVNVGTLVLFHSGFDWPLAAATTAAFVVAFAFTFTLNRLWVFDAGDGAAGGQVVRYLLLVGVNYVATLAIVLGLAEVGVAVVVAKTVAVAVIAVSNFFVYRHFVFRTPAADTVPVAPQSGPTGPVEEES